MERAHENSCVCRLAARSISPSCDAQRPALLLGFVRAPVPRSMRSAWAEGSQNLWRDSENLSRGAEELSALSPEPDEHGAQPCEQLDDRFDFGALAQGQRRDGRERRSRLPCLGARRAETRAAIRAASAAEIGKASDEASSAVPGQERLKELVLYAVSEPYFAIRRKLVITIDS